MRESMHVYEISPKGRWPDYVVDRTPELAASSVALRFRLPEGCLRANDVTNVETYPRRFEDRDAAESLRRIVVRGVSGYLVRRTGGYEIFTGANAHMRMVTMRPLEETSNAWEFHPWKR